MSNSYAYGDYYSDLDSVADDKAPDRYTDPLFVFVAILLTSEPIWFSFTIQLFIGPENVANITITYPL